MGIDEKMQLQGGCPSGKAGRFFAVLMNIVHMGAYKFGIDYVDIREDMNVLDIGCGGGKLLKVLSQKVKNGRVVGIDHSNDMVVLAAKKNKKRRNIAVHYGSVSELSFGEGEFDIVTAFETIQFWPDIKNDLKEVVRVLKPGGVFLITNRFPAEGSGWTQFLKLKSEREYIDALSDAGFHDIKADTQSKKNWIRISAKKSV